MSDLPERITSYLSSGGLVNPELADHDAVRDLIIDCRNELERLRAENEHFSAKLTRDGKTIHKQKVKIEWLQAALRHCKEMYHLSNEAELALLDKLDKIAVLLPGKALEVYTNRPIPRTVVRNLIDADKVKAILEDKR